MRYEDVEPQLTEYHCRYGSHMTLAFLVLHTLAILAAHDTFLQ
jgi:hypothetical protein